MSLQERKQLLDSIAALLPPEPDENGEFKTPADGAVYMAVRHGKRQTLLHGKAAFIPGWETSATTDPAQIRALAAQNPGCNFGSVADDGEILEVDSLEVRKRFDGNFSNTLTIASSEGKGHRYYLPADVEHIAQNATKHGDFSLRKGNAYCVSPGSVHPETGKQYRIAINAPMVAPSQQEIDFWNSERTDKGRITASPDGEKIPRGSHDTALTRIGGRLRADGLEEEAIYNALIEVCEKRCENFGSDYREMIRKISKSVCRYKIQPSGPETVLIGGHVAGTVGKTSTPASVAAVPEFAKLKFEIDSADGAIRPEFPRWCMTGTSLFENLAKPVSEVNSKYPELIWMPAVQLLMNSLQGKIKYNTVNTNLNLFLGIVSPPGKFFKSSSCELAHEFFKYAGLADTYRTSMRNAEGKTIILQAGSSEGFGLRASELNAKAAILFNDELGRLVAKAGVENSSLSSDLLQWYESGYFGNTITSKKNTFSFGAGEYCFGWCFATTTKGFNKQWPKLAGTVSGLEDRMFFLVTPEKPKELVMETYVPIHEKAVETRKLYDAAINQGVFELVDSTEAQMVAGKFDNPRSMNMLFKFALYFAVDLGKQIVDESCLERAAALVKYREQAAAYLAPIEADNAQARLQQEIVRELKQNRGKMSYRELCRELNYKRIGTYQWNTAINGLEGDEDVFLFEEAGKRGQVKKMIGLRKWDDE